jgi:hypothetical protein
MTVFLDIQKYHNGLNMNLYIYISYLKLQNSYIPVIHESQHRSDNVSFIVFVY